jgi:hypothetical protein
MNPREEIEALMKSHDWYYKFADDMKAWRKGTSEKTLIIDKMRKLPLSDVQELLKLVPEDLSADWFFSFSKVENENT